MTASGLIRAGAPMPCQPWPRTLLSQEAWYAMAHALPAEPGLAFSALWADATHVHALFQADAPLVASVAVEAGLYAALSPARPGAALFERAIADLWGHQAADAVDVRPWLDHGTWPLLRPLSDRPVPNVGPTAPELQPDQPEMIAEPGDLLALGPLPPTLEGDGWGGAIGPALWHATLRGGTVARLEARLGWSNRGLAGLIRGKSPGGAARLVARIDGTATVAHATAFARAVEAALGIDAPPAAQGLRSLLLALERAAVRLHALAAASRACLRPDPSLMEMREALLDASDAAFGHRLLMDLVRPGGVAADPPAGVLVALDDVLATIADTLPAASCRGWPRRGALPVAAALALAVPGPPGRAAGRMDPAAIGAPLHTAGTLAERMDLLTQALHADIEAARTAVANVPAGATALVLPHAAAEGLGQAEGPRGPVWHWVRLANGVVADSFAASPDWLLLPALERSALGLPPGALAAHVASFGLQAAGIDQ